MTHASRTHIARTANPLAAAVKNAQYMHVLQTRTAIALIRKYGLVAGSRHAAKQSIPVPRVLAALRSIETAKAQREYLTRYNAV